MESLTLNAEPIELQLSTIEGPGGSELDYTRGNRIYRDRDQDPIIEKDVFFIDHIGVPDAYQGASIGTHLFEDAIELARQEDFPMVRMGIIEPKVIKMVQTQVRKGNIKQAAFAVADSIHPSDELGSRDVLAGDHGVQPEQAANFLNHQKELWERAIADGQDENPYMRGITCVFTI